MFIAILSLVKALIGQMYDIFGEAFPKFLVDNRVCGIQMPTDPGNHKSTSSGPAVKVFSARILYWHPVNTSIYQNN